MKGEAIEVREIDYAELRRIDLSERATNGQLDRQLDLEAAYEEGRQAAFPALLTGLAIGAATVGTFWLFVALVG